MPEVWTRENKREENNYVQTKVNLLHPFQKRVNIGGRGKRRQKLIKDITANAQD